jgi:hypothetical protein
MLVEDGRTGFLHEVPGPYPWRQPWQRFQPLRSPVLPGAYRPAPPGWPSPAAPFTGAPPRRLFMRCSVWPAPPGQAPPFASQPYMPGMQPYVPGIPGTPALPPAMQAAAARRRRGRWRRRR